MPPMPPEFYAPAFGFLISMLGLIGTACKVLWARNTILADRLHDYEGGTAKEATRALALSSDALRANTDIFTRLADVALRPTITRAARERRSSSGGGAAGE